MTTFDVLEQYQPRRIRCHGVREVAGWRLKLYAIAYGRDRARDELLEATIAAAAEKLPQPPALEHRYGVGFLGVHDGRGGNFAYVDWWSHENELHHHVYFSTSSRPAELRAADSGDPIACVWDLSVLAHERAAWIRHCLARTGGPDLDAYLADQMDGPV